ncbi:unnamed protein product [Microthlaspi erraticum]|uniref:F-box associated domain-containing protein n=1 Tax=Microthlaspi erraticum TaxID=1685480 RepID=A0A6D2HQL2_9BRAS|nr:unnamed protein product [Microthlaspi erraticum]
MTIRGAFSGEAASLESPSRDRLVRIERLVEVHLKDGSVYSGIIHAVEEHHGIILKMASLIEDGTLKGHQSRYEAVKKPPPTTFLIPADEVVQVVVAKDLSVSSDGMLNAVQGEKQGELLTYSSISQSCLVDQRRELKPADEDVPENLVNVFDNPGNRGWDQFWVNESLFGVRNHRKREENPILLKEGRMLENCSKRMMKTISDFPGDLVEEGIFSRAPLTCLRSVRSTCKKWNALSKNLVLGKAAARKQFTGFMIMDHRVCWMEFDLGNMVGPCIKQVRMLDQIGISNVIDCEGLLLCVIEDRSRLLVWNPYLGQTRWIKPRTEFKELDVYALGYDKHGNNKILSFSEQRSGKKFVLEMEIYDSSSDSWKVLDVTPDWELGPRQRFVSLKGNVYFPAKKATVSAQEGRKEEFFLLCFDCTTERFSRRLPLPFHWEGEGIFVSLSCVRQEQLALLYQRWDWFTSDSIEFYLTTKVDPNAVSWTKFLITLNAFPVHPYAGSFFIDEEKKLAVVFDLEASGSQLEARYQCAHIIGEDGYLTSVNIGDAPNPRAVGQVSYFIRGYCLPLVCSPCVPSLVQLQINQQSNCKQSS